MSKRATRQRKPKPPAVILGNVDNCRELFLAELPKTAESLTRAEREELYDDVIQIMAEVLSYLMFQKRRLNSEAA